MTILENLMQNIYRNNDPNLAKDLKNAKLPLKAMQADAAAKLLETLLPGESTLIKGKVLDLRQDMVLLQLLTGEELSARTETSLPLSIGDTAEFIVAGKDGKLITLKLAGKENNETAEVQKMVRKALDAAGITPTERSETVVRELMQHSCPINEANIKKFMALSAKNPDIPVRELVLMDVAKIPLTKENIAIYRDFGNSEPVAEFAAAVTEISERIENLPEGQLKTELTQELKNLLNEMLGNGSEKNVSDNVPLNTSSPASGQNSPLPQSPVQEGTSQQSAVSEIPVSENSETPISDSPLVSNTGAQSEPLESNASALPDKTEISEKAPTRSANEIHEALHIPPKDFARPEKIKKLYEKLENASEKLRRLEERITSESGENIKDAALRSAPQTHAAKLSSTLKFMDSVNNVFPFVQLPVKLKEENARGDLYVYERKRAFKSGDTFSALLHLDLDNLGETDILIKLTGQNAVVTISAATETAKDVFSSEVPDLTEALKKKGYSLNCDINVSEDKEEKVPLLTQFLEAHSPSLVSRFSFDMRA